MDIDTKLEKRNAELQRIRDAKARWWKKISRAVTAYDKLCAEEKRLLKPQPLAPEAKLKIESKDWHKIREMHLSDEIPDFLRREGA